MLCAANRRIWDAIFTTVPVVSPINFFLRLSSTLPGLQVIMTLTERGKDAGSHERDRLNLDLKMEALQLRIASMSSSPSMNNMRGFNPQTFDTTSEKAATSPCISSGASNPSLAYTHSCHNHRRSSYINTDSEATNHLETTRSTHLSRTP